LDVAGNFFCRRALLFDRRSDTRGDLVDISDGPADAGDRTDRFVGYRLNGADLFRDLLVRFGLLYRLFALPGNVGCKLYDFERSAVAVERRPEFFVFITRCKGRLSEHAVVLALHFLQVVAHHRLEILVGRGDRSVHFELDYHLRFADRVERLPKTAWSSETLAGSFGSVLVS